MEQFEARVLPASLSLGPAGLHRAEGGPATLQATLSQTQMMPVSGYFRTWPGTATENTDYTGTTSQSFTIPPGASFVNISIPALTDYSTEGDETFSVELLSAMGATIDPAAKIRVVTIDDVVFGGGGGGGGSTTLTLSVPADVDEGEDFVLTAQLSPPGIYQINAMINWGATPGAGSAGFQGNTNPNGSFSVSGRYHDDGPAGNGTDSDVQSITLTGTATQYSPQGPVSSPLSGLASTTIHNVDPTPVFQVYNVPTLGDPWYKASGTFQDVGLADKGTLTIDWGDGSPPFIYPNMSVGTMIDPTHRYPPDGLVYTITMTMTDDDTGVVSDDFSIALYLFDLDNDANNNGEINAFDEPFEPPANGPGRYVTVNSDDDNGNEIPDKDEFGPISGEDDLEPFLIRWDGSMRPDINFYYGWHITLEAAFEEAPPYLLKPRIWFTPDKSPVSTSIDADGDGLLNLRDLTEYNLGYTGFGFDWTIGQTPILPQILYLEARQPGAIPPLYLKLRPPMGGALPIEQDTIAFTAIPMDSDVNIHLYHGQFGKLVKDVEEVSIGAFTVAEHNDTDGDALRDWDTDDWSHHDSPGGHAATRGRDEVDLIRVVIDRPANYIAGTPITLEVSWPGPGAYGVALWKESERLHRVMSLDWTSYELILESGESKIDLWAQLLDPSDALRDYEFKAVYGAASDLALATGIWARQFAAAYDVTSAAAVFAQAPWSELPVDNPLRKYVTKVGGTGVRPIAPDDVFPGVHNVILTAWQVSPPGIEDIPFVKFDVTRRKEHRSDVGDSDGGNFPVGNTNYPLELERPNDDPDNESQFGPNEFGHLFSLDDPGRDGFHDPVFNRERDSLNIQEFVRASLNGIVPAGEVIIGSRSSDILEWYSRWHIVRTGATWARAAVPHNDIDNGKQNWLF